MSVLIEWVWSIVEALLRDGLYRDLVFLIYVIIVSNPFVACAQTLRWIRAGYIDVLYLDDLPRLSFLRFSVILFRPVRRRVLALSGHAISLLSQTIWNNLGIIMTLVSCFLVLRHILPAGWRNRSQNMWDFVQLWASLGPTTIFYAVAVVGDFMLKKTTIVRRTVNNSLSSDTHEFSYSSAPDFDPRTQIRILRLEKRLPFREPRVELLSCSLQNAPAYHAISYAWTQGAQDTRTIKLNGMSMQVKGNVYDIIERCSSSYESYHIWIDTICIDQTSSSEKTMQVRKMQEIYSRAAHVLVCLGNGPAFLAFDMILELKEVRQRIGDAYLPRHIAGLIARQRTDFYLRARLKALDELLQHTWFQRIWVVQEVIVARSVTVCYGRKSMPWSKFHEKLKILSGPVVTSLAAIHPQADSLVPVANYFGIPSMPFIVTYRLDYHQFGPQSMSHLLRVFGEREATVPLDKVFALIGLAKRYSADLRQLVDYRPEAQEVVLLDLANFLLENGEALDVLEMTGMGWSSYNPKLPSWAVDWTVMRSSMPLTRKSSLHAGHYCATANMVSMVRRGGSRQELVVRGQYLDRICCILPIGNAQGPNAQPNDLILRALLSYLELCLDMAMIWSLGDSQSPYAGLRSQSLEEAVWRTLIGDRTRSERPAPSFYGRVVRSQVQVLSDLVQVSQSYVPSMMASDHVRESLQAQWGHTRVQEIQQDYQHFYEINLLFDSGRGSNPHVFCTTESGYIGMVPQLSKVGDIVCLIHGLDVPYVLRKFGGKHRLVGDSYIHGIMDGEGLQLAYADEDFQLV
jgi:hypothetical protein